MSFDSGSNYKYPKKNTKNQSRQNPNNMNVRKVEVAKLSLSNMDFIRAINESTLRLLEIENGKMLPMAKNYGIVCELERMQHTITKMKGHLAENTLDEMDHYFEKKKKI